MTIEKQEKFFTKSYANGKGFIKVKIRHDDSYGNGYNSFAITANILEDRCEVAGGCCHEEVIQHFPELEPFIKWHCCSTEGPMHYVANTVYWAKEGNLHYARKSAIWPDATLDDLQNIELLQARLPALLAEFRTAVESLGLEF